MQFSQHLAQDVKHFCTILTILFFPIAILSVISRNVHGKWRLIVFPAVLILQGMAFKTDIMLGLATGAVAAGLIATLNDAAGITRYVMSSLGWRGYHEMQMQAILKMIELEPPSMEAYFSRAENELGCDMEAILEVLVLPEVEYDDGILTLDAPKPLERMQNQQQLTENDKLPSTPPNDMPYETQGQANLEIIERDADSSGSYEMQKQAMLKMIELESPSLSTLILRTENEFRKDVMCDVLASSEVRLTTGF